MMTPTSAVASVEPVNLDGPTYIPVVSIHPISMGYRCDGSANCEAWAELQITAKETDDLYFIRRFCCFHAAYRLGVIR